MFFLFKTKFAFNISFSYILVFAAVAPPAKPPESDNKKTINISLEALNRFIRHKKRKISRLYGMDEIIPVKNPLPLTFLYTVTAQINPPSAINK